MGLWCTVGLWCMVCGVDGGAESECGQLLPWCMDLGRGRTVGKEGFEFCPAHGEGFHRRSDTA